MTWVVLENESPSILQKIEEIATTLFNNELTNHTGLMWGKTGVALFFFYYSRFTQQEKYHQHAVQLMDQVFDEIGMIENNSHTISEGLAGIGWAIEHLAKNKFDDIPTDEVLEDVDHFLAQALELEIREKNYSYLHGYLGLGWYFINRLPGKGAEDCLVRIVEALAAQGVPGKAGGISWQSQPGEDRGIPRYDLSLAQGISAVVVFLSKLYQLDICKEKVTGLLSGAVTYILQQSLDIAVYKSNFPRWVNESVPSRMEWAFGDPGIGIALWQAARRTDNPGWEKEALRILLHSAARKDFREENVFASGLFNGAAGLSLLYNRMYHYTGNETFKETAKHWLELTMGLGFKPGGLAGYKVWRNINDHQSWINDAGLLEGISGIGLTLLSTISTIEPRWDECLLLS